MRLWHEDLITKLPLNQLLGQNRECCAMRGLGWGKKHSTVDYVFTHPYFKLYTYHKKIMDIMLSRNYKVEKLWYNPQYRGKKLGFDTSEFTNICDIDLDSLIYYEHNDKYLQECLENLKQKGVLINYE